MENCKAANIPETFSTEVTGNRVRDHYARNIYPRVSLKMAVRWSYRHKKILY